MSIKPFYAVFTRQNSNDQWVIEPDTISSTFTGVRINFDYKVDLASKSTYLTVFMIDKSGAMNKIRPVLGKI